jgi:hypothetical protein
VRGPFVQDCVNDLLQSAMHTRTMSLPFSPAHSTRQATLVFDVELLKINGRTAAQFKADL